MKPILIATDYSTAALNAADFAAQLAVKTKSTLILFHAQLIPTFDQGVLSISDSIQQLKDTSNDNLNVEAKRLEDRWKIKPILVLTEGNVVHEIEKCCIDNNVEFVVMGMRQTDPIEQVFGSVVTEFVKKSSFPLLVIPEVAKFRYPEKLLFAADICNESDWKEVGLLKRIATLFSSIIHVLYVVPQGADLKDKVCTDSVTFLENNIGELPHSWHYEEAGDIVHGIHKKALELAPQWIVVVHHHLSWLKRFFNRSLTRQIAFTSNIPLLILPKSDSKI